MLSAGVRGGEPGGGRPAAGTEDAHTEGCRIAVVVGIRLYLEGLAVSLGRDYGFEVVVTAEDAMAAGALLRASSPDLVVLDMATSGSLELARSLSAASTDMCVVGLVVEETKEDVIACVEAGIAAYVPRHATLDALVSALRGAARGEARCSPAVTGGLMRRVADLAVARGNPGASPLLTPREEEILVLIDLGLSNKEIAQRLFIEVATVKNHVHNILEKLSVSTRAQAAVRMRSLGYGARAARAARAYGSEPAI